MSVKWGVFADREAVLAAVSVFWAFIADRGAVWGDVSVKWGLFADRLACLFADGAKTFVA